MPEYRTEYIDEKKQYRFIIQLSENCPKSLYHKQNPSFNQNCTRTVNT